jgi:cobalamin biosynthetic protein CobC
MQDHGGNIDVARQIHGGDDWIDLSTGINRCPYPVPAIPAQAWTMLPTGAAKAALRAAAAQAFATSAAIVAVPGAQGAIQMLPHLRAAGTARIVGPTYQEYEDVLRGAGWQVEQVTDLAALPGADLALVVNPNNPDGRCHDPADLVALVGRVGLLVVDESFADPVPRLSLAPRAGTDGLLVLRSFGKFYGLAGVRLGFALGSGPLIDRLAALAGPWPISGAAIEIGRAALADRAWAAATIDRLTRETTRLDALAGAAGWPLVGGTALFRLYRTPDAGAAQARLAGRRIWSRRFGYSSHWLRLGLPGDAAEWDRLAAALAD